MLLAVAIYTCFFCAELAAARAALPPPTSCYCTIALQRRPDHDLELQHRLATRGTYNRATDPSIRPARARDLPRGRAGPTDARPASSPGAAWHRRAVCDGRQDIEAPVRRRGLAIGIAALGTQFGGFLYPPIFAAAMEAYEWRLALGSLGLLIVLIMPVLIRLFIVDQPADKGLHPDGDDAPAAAEATNRAKPAKLSLLSLFKQRNFVLVVLIVGAAVATNTVLLANLSLFATDLGEEAVRGAFLISLVALLGIFFSPFVGWLSDVINIKWVTALITASLAVCCLIFSVATSYPILLTAAFFMGVGGGGVFPLWASLVGKLYDTRIYGQVMGATTRVIALFTAAGPPFGGWVHDTTQSYRLLFLTLLVILAVMTLLITFIKVPQTGEPD